MVNPRENKARVHEVAAKLIEEKKQGPGDGKHFLGLFGSSSAAEQ